MKVVRIELHHRSAPLGSPVGRAGRRWHERRGVWIRVHEAGGTVGQGEASPLPGYSPDTLEQATRALEAAAARLPWRLDPGAPALEAITAVLGDVARPAPSARFALETALLDLLGQWHEVPVHALIEPRRHAGRLPVAAHVEAEGDDATRAGVCAAASRGFSCVKIKVGRRPDAELGWLERVRETSGVALRLDANGALPARRARRWLRAVAARVRPELIEEPVPLSVLRTMAPSGLRIALDESLQHARAPWVDELAATGRCHALVLKPMALGGIAASVRWAEQAKRLGLDVIVSHLFDGPIALAASAELALAIAADARATPAAGLAPHGGLDAWPTIPRPAFGAVTIGAHRRAGLGTRLPEPRPQGASA